MNQNIFREYDIRGIAEQDNMIRLPIHISEKYNKLRKSRAQQVMKPAMVASMDFKVVSSSSRTTEKSAATSSQGSALRAGVGSRRMSEPHRPRSPDDHGSGPVDYSRGLPDHHEVPRTSASSVPS